MSTGDSTRLFLIRHGEVEAPYLRVFGGRIDMGLSPRGVEQARALAERLQSSALHALYASPLRRAQDTAQPLAAVHGLAVRTLPELRETDFGAWTGLRWEEVAERFGVSAFDWLQLLEHGAIPGAETGPQLRQRLQPCVEQILTSCRGRTAAVVCHGGVIRGLLALLLDLPLPRMAGFEIDYASLTIVRCGRGKAEVTLLNYTPWNGLP
jgi:broad specificity phosphatase PhoE